MRGIRNQFSGDVRISARHIHGANLSARSKLVDGLDALSHNDPSVANPIIDYHTRGAIPVCRRTAPPAPRVRGVPYRRRQSVDIMEKIWKDVRNGRISARRTYAIAEFGHVACAPSKLVAEKLRDRALSAEMRFISGARLVANLCDKDEYSTCVNPTLGDIAKRREFRGRVSPWFT